MKAYTRMLVICLCLNLISGCAYITSPSVSKKPTVENATPKALPSGGAQAAETAAKTY